MLSSIKMYLYAAVGVLLLVFGVATCHHIEQIGVKKEAAKIEKVEKKEQAQVAAVQTQAQTTESQSAIIYKQAVSIPAVGDIGLVCQRPARGVPLPAAAPGVAAAAGARAADSPEGPPYDPSGAVLTRGAAADAQIAYLQRRVLELEAEMNGAP